MHQIFLGQQDPGSAEDFEECGKKPAAYRWGIGAGNLPAAPEKEALRQMFERSGG